MLLTESLKNQTKWQPYLWMDRTQWTNNKPETQNTKTQKPASARHEL